MSSLSSRTRSAPAGFIEPCLPSPADKPASGANWIHEIKHDGYRLMARRDLLTRRGNDWANRFPLVVEAVNHLKVRSCLIGISSGVSGEGDNSSSICQSSNIAQNISSA